MPSEFEAIKQKPIDRKRLLSEEISVIEAFFDRLEIVIRTRKIRRENVYNFDETNFQPGRGKAQRVITRHPERALIRHETGHESLTATEYVAADGFVGNPLFILTGKWHMEDWHTITGLPDEYMLCPQINGYTTDEIAFQWIQRFHEETRLRAPYGAYRLLLFDGHGSHLTYEFLEFCDKKRIIPFCFPPHTTHLLQPLDGKPFQQYKHYFYKQNNAIVTWGGSTGDKRDFLRGIQAVREQTFKPKTIRHAFAERGIYPVKPELVVDPLYRRRIPSIDIEFHIGSTPPPPSSPTTIGSSPPDTVHRLRKGIEKVEKSLQDIKDILDAESPQLRKRLGRVFRGSLIQAELNAQREADVKRLLHLKSQREAKKSRRRVQVGGILSVKDANRRIEARKLEELEKLKAKGKRAAQKVAKKKALEQHLTAETPQRIRELGGIPPEDDEEVNFVIDSIGALE
jgi:hypothetical protein